MKIKLISLFIAVITFHTLAGAVNPKPFTAPEIREWKGKTGFYDMPLWADIVYTDSTLSKTAEIFASQLKSLLHHSPTVRKGNSTSGEIVLTLGGGDKLGEEGYTLTTTDNRITIKAPTANGVAWGTQTLLQLLRQSHEVPKGTITDYPDYKVRGLMIDAGRKYIPLDYLYKLVDDMAYYKMNRLHVHLNDNGFKYYFDDDWDKTQAAFRMESDIFPGLTARDGSYGKEEYRAFQKYAADRGVDIVSEIDVPAHCLALTRFMPETASANENNDRDHLDLDSPATYELLDKLIAEYLDTVNPVFLSPRFHIGTDEYQGDSATMEKFRAFTDRYIKYVKSFGKEPVIWGSLSHAKGETPVEVDGVEMYLWSNDYAKPQEMLDLGYNVVSVPDRWVYIVPKAGYYYDYLNNKKLYEEWTPAYVNTVKLEERHPQIRGGMFCVWNDHPNNGITVKDIHHRIMHSLPVMAAKTWNGADVTVPFEEFETQSTLLGEAPGVNYLGIQSSKPATILLLSYVLPGDTLTYDEIGYDYLVEFDIECEEEEKGTPLFYNDEATVWLSDPISGKMGYSREGYLNTFRFDIRPGEKHHVRFVGTNHTVSLYIDGKLIDDMNERWLSYNGSNRKMAQVRTLVFPLLNTGNYRSTISELRVRQL